MKPKPLSEASSRQRHGTLIASHSAPLTLFFMAVRICVPGWISLVGSWRRAWLRTHDGVWLRRVNATQTDCDRRRGVRPKRCLNARLKCWLSEKPQRCAISVIERAAIAGSAMSSRQRSSRRSQIQPRDRLRLAFEQLVDRPAGKVEAYAEIGVGQIAVDMLQDRAAPPLAHVHRRSSIIGLDGHLDQTRHLPADRHAVRRRQAVAGHEGGRGAGVKHFCRPAQEAARLAPPVGGLARRRQQRARHADGELARMLGRVDLEGDVAAQRAPLAGMQRAALPGLMDGGAAFLLEQEFERRAFLRRCGAAALGPAGSAPSRRCTGRAGRTGRAEGRLPVVLELDMLGERRRAPLPAAFGAAVRARRDVCSIAPPQPG